MTKRIPYERAVQVGGPPISIAIATIATVIANALHLGPGAGAQITHIEHLIAGHMQSTSIAAPGDPVAQAIFSVGVFIVSALVPHLSNLKWLDGSVKWAQLSGLTAPAVEDPEDNQGPPAPAPAAKVLDQQTEPPPTPAAPAAAPTPTPVAAATPMQAPTLPVILTSDGSPIAAADFNPVSAGAPEPTQSP